MRRTLAGALAATLTLLLTAEAWARVGGGQGFSTGRPSGGGSYGGGGSFSGGGEGVDLGPIVWWLLVEHPEIGVPLLIVVAVAWWLTQRQQARAGGSWTIEGSVGGRAQVHRPRHDARRGWSALAREDAGLSEPVVLDAAQRVVRRALEASTETERAGLASQVAPELWSALARTRPEPVADVILASTAIAGVRRVGRFDELDVDVTACWTARGRTTYVEQRWTFRRAAGVQSLPPEQAVRMGCPSCGSAMGTTPLGACLSCGTAIGHGELAWQASSVATSVQRDLGAPDLHLNHGGEEPGYRVDLPVDPGLPVASRAFRGRHPDHDDDAFERRVRHVFLALQGAWDAGDWNQARPWVTDGAWGTLRFWMDRYRREGLRNRVADVEIHGLRLLRITVDAWYESITVRVWASCKDWTEVAATGEVVSGNRTAPRHFSECWTFLRAVGAHSATQDPARCPSCGAPLDRIEAAGKCGYCGSIITTGRFDWVLSRIEQPEVYRP